MAEKKLRPGQKIKMVSVDELLGVEGEESSLELEIAKIRPFQNHPFKVLDDEKMEELVNSIEKNGVLTPVLVRPVGLDRYEMVSGHRRMHAAQKAGLTKIPGIIRDMTSDEATIVMVEANSQREEVLPSEKAFAYKMRYDAMKRKAGRPEKNSCRVGTGLRSDHELADQVSDSARQIQRYIRLTVLIPDLLDMVDKKKMPVQTAVEISYIDQQTQKYLCEYIEENGMIKSYQATALRRYVEANGPISQQKTIHILNEGIYGKTVAKSINFSEKKLRKYFPAKYSVSEMEQILIGLLEKWKEEQGEDDYGI